MKKGENGRCRYKKEEGKIHGNFSAKLSAINDKGKKDSLSEYRRETGDNEIE